MFYSFLINILLALHNLSMAEEVSCPACFWYCLKRDPKEASQVKVTDTSNRRNAWEWDTSTGKWAVVYQHSFSSEVDCSVDYTPSRAQTSRLISWKFSDNKLILSYSANPMRIYREQHWKMKILGGETWGFTPATDGSWTFSVYSRNVVIRPFEKSSGSFNLQMN